MDWAALGNLELWNFEFHGNRLRWTGIQYVELNEIPDSPQQEHMVPIVPG